MISSDGNSASWARTIFSKLDTKNQGYIEKIDLEAAFAKVGGASGTTTDSTAADKVFEKLDTDSDGKIDRNEAHAFRESSKTSEANGGSGTSKTNNDSQALSRIIQLLRMYGASDTTSAASTASTLPVTA